MGVSELEVRAMSKTLEVDIAYGTAMRVTTDALLQERVGICRIVTASAGVLSKIQWRWDFT